MSKKQSQPIPIEDDPIDEEVKAIMGLPPEEADPSSVVDETISAAVDPKGPPEVTDDAKLQDELDAPVVEEAIEADNKEEPATADTTKDDDINATAAEINETLKSQVISADAKPADDQVNDELDDPDLTAAVTDIIAKEGDDLLAAEDAKKATFEPPKKTRKNPFGFIGAWWHSKRARTITLAVIAAALLGLAIYPATRYAILNTLGVRASLSLRVVDSKYGVPIKNAQVLAGGQTGITDSDGKVQLSKVKLGKTELVITKRSFATVNQTIIIGWGSNPYSDPFQMTPTGSTYNFVITDWLSGKPIEKAAVSDGESTALTDKDGKTTLTIQPTDRDIQLTIKADDYRLEKVVISATDTNEKAVKLVAGQSDVFVSKRSGKYDLYKRDADGTNETVLIGATGSEQDPLGLLVHRDGAVAAFVSTRDGKRDSSGHLLSNLYMVDVNGKTATKVADTEAAQIQLIDWVGDKLVFVKIVSGPSAATNGRQRILVYDMKQDKLTELAAVNYFNDVEVYKGQVYYAPSSGGNVPAQLYRVNLDGSAKTVLVDKETWATYRTSYDTLLANAADNKWYQQTLGDNKMTLISGAPASTTHRIYVDSPNGEKTVWIDNRDGKGVLILQNVKDKSIADQILVSKGGLSYPVRWLSNKHLLVRISNTTETADYVLNIDGGDMKKVGDVTNTAATSRWYYY